MRGGHTSPQFKSLEYASICINNDSATLRTSCARSAALKRWNVGFRLISMANTLESTSKNSFNNELSAGTVLIKDPKYKSSSLTLFIICSSLRLPKNNFGGNFAGMLKPSSTILELKR